MSEDKLPKLNPLEQIVADLILKKTSQAYLRGYEDGLKMGQEIVKEKLCKKHRKKALDFALRQMIGLVSANIKDGDKVH